MDRSKEFFEYAEHVYDEENMRTYSKEERDVGRERDYYMKIHLYKEVKQLQKHFRTKSLTVLTALLNINC